MENFFKWWKMSFHTFQKKNINRPLWAPASMTNQNKITIHFFSVLILFIYFYISKISHIDKTFILFLIFSQKRVENLNCCLNSNKYGTLKLYLMISQFLIQMLVILFEKNWNNRSLLMIYKLHYILITNYLKKKWTCSLKY